MYVGERIWKYVCQRRNREVRVGEDHERGEVLLGRVWVLALLLQDLLLLYLRLVRFLMSEVPL